MKIKIKVTKEILEKSMFCGTRYFAGVVAENCAISLAIRDLFPNVCVGKKLISKNKELYYTTRGKTVKEILDLNSENHILLPSIASTFINIFDTLRYNIEDRLKLKPIEFEVDFPESWIEDITIEEAIQIINKSETLELV